MHLCLINNDPTSTLLISPEGEPWYSIETPPRPHLNIVDDGRTEVRSRPPEHDGPTATMTTVVKRLNRVHMSSGHVESEIATVEYCGPGKGIRLTFCSRLCELKTAKEAADDGDDDENGGQMYGSAMADGDEDKDLFVLDDVDVEDESANSWEFMGPDSRRYRWQLFVHSPVLVLAEHPSTALALFKQAKIGIVSRPRRAYLEILPTGMHLRDFIVVTFVAFMKQRIINDMMDPPRSVSSSTSEVGDDSPRQSPGMPCSPLEFAKMASLARVHTA
ncbi:hypothetical protein CPC08DRAFT_755566 [Agrocybe pediades]|nr:hypothetical protein CPC08DRAFT_755566 [Agrocybe pediades]